MHLGAMKKVLIFRPVAAVVVVALVEEGADEVALAEVGDTEGAGAEGEGEPEGAKPVLVNVHGRTRIRPAEGIITVNGGTIRRWLALVLLLDPRLRIADNAMQLQDI